MKRSEAVIALNNFIDKHGAAGSDILEFLESIGMLPPAYFGEIKTVECAKVDPIEKIAYFETKQAFGLKNEWEAEGDKAQTKESK